MSWPTVAQQLLQRNQVCLYRKRRCSLMRLIRWNGGGCTCTCVQVLDLLVEIIGVEAIVCDNRALARRHAIQFAIEVGFWSIIFEGDSLAMVKALNDIRPAIEDAKALVTHLR
ncbi:hypothetical protein CFP56_003227 [Quercus suber]|uniref:RNase H type-1 domain-containing protein n=1 Tax=Quercus suber TaxID=58331 RepID=A0AAW0LCR8_QUESU